MATRLRQSDSTGHQPLSTTARDARPAPSDAPGTSGAWDDAKKRLMRLARPRGLRSAGAALPPVDAAALVRSPAPVRSDRGAPPLPWDGQWSCSRCSATVAGAVDEHAGALELRFACPTCGSYSEPLERPRVGVVPSTSAQDMAALLITCHCPECDAALYGRAYARQGVVWVEMTCPAHGYFRDRVETDPQLFAELLAAPRPEALPGGPSLTVVSIDPEDVRGGGGTGVLAALDHARASGERVCVTTTINRAVNRERIGPLFEFAVANVDAIAALVFQPVTFTERVSLQQLADQRYTLGELAREIARRSGADVGRDFLPLSQLAAIPAVLGLERMRAMIARAADGRWSVGAYFVVGAGGRPTPLGRFFHLGRLLDVAQDAARRAAGRGRPRVMSLWERIRLGFLLAGCLRRVSRETRWLPLRLLRSWRGLREAPGAAPGGADVRLLLVAGVQSPDRYRFTPPC